MARNHKSHADAVIFTALPLESQAVCKHLSNVGEERHSTGNIYQVGAFSAGDHSLRVAVVEVGKGNVRAAVQTERAITHFNPDSVLFVGIAGGVKDVGLGDIVVASKVYEYQSGKSAKIFQTRPEVWQSDYTLVELANAEARKTDWMKRLPGSSVPSARVHVGPMAAGEIVVASRDSEVFSLIAYHYSDVIALDMESCGFLEAVRSNNVRGLVVRAISDQIDNKSEADMSGCQEIAAQRASAFAFEVLAKADIGGSRYRTRRRAQPTSVAVPNPNFAEPYPASLEITLETIGQRLMEKRGDRRILEVCREIGISRATLQRVERGLRPNIETFGKVCRWLELDPGEILTVRLMQRPRPLQGKTKR